VNKPAINARVSRTEFRSDVCCEHSWVPDESKTSVFDDVCAKCGATCTRGRDGSIEEYDAGVWADYAGGEL